MNEQPTPDHIAALENLINQRDSLHQTKGFLLAAHDTRDKVSTETMVSNQDQVIAFNSSLINNNFIAIRESIDKQKPQDILIDSTRVITKFVDWLFTHGETITQAATQKLLMQYLKNYGVLQFSTEDISK